MWDIDFTHEKSVSLVVLKQLSRAISLNFHNCKEVLVVLTLINKVSLIWLIVLAFSAHSLSRIGCGRFLTSFLNRLSAEVFCGAHFLQYSGLAVGVWTYLWEKAGSGTKCEWSIMTGVALR